MKRFLPWIIGAVLILGIYSYVKGINNTAVTYEQDINEAWGNVQTSYQTTHRKLHEKRMLFWGVSRVQAIG